MGSRPAVVLCGYEAVKEALVDHAEAFGLFFTNGERWRQLRRFSLTTLRDFGMGKRSIEERIQEEARFLVEEIKKTEGHQFDPSIALSCASANLICSIVFGSRFEYEDKEFIAFLDLIKKIIALLFFPWTQLPSEPTGRPLGGAAGVGPLLWCCATLLPASVLLHLARTPLCLSGSRWVRSRGPPLAMVGHVGGLLSYRRLFANPGGDWDMARSL
ncbi:UNVERIFIED_CONTAM: hypothetical protein K2H54_037394 [Gekko kuhli]